MVTAGMVLEEESIPIWSCLWSYLEIIDTLLVHSRYLTCCAAATAPSVFATSLRCPALPHSTSSLIWTKWYALRDQALVAAVSSSFCERSAHTAFQRVLQQCAQVAMHAGLQPEQSKSSFQCSTLQPKPTYRHLQALRCLHAPSRQVVVHRAAS